MIISHHKDPQGNDTIVLNASHINFGAVGTKRIGLSQEFSSHWFVVSKFDMKILSGFYAFLWEVCADRHLLQAWALRECWDSKTVCARLSPSWGSVQFSFLIQKNSTIYLVQQQGSCLQLVNMECSDRTSLAFLMTCWVSFEALCGAGKPRVNRALIIKSHVLSTSLALRFWDAHVSDGHMLYRGWAWMNIEHNVWSQTLYKTSQPLNDTLHLRMALHGIPFFVLCTQSEDGMDEKAVRRSVVCRSASDVSEFPTSPDTACS